jgi:ribosome-binding factor A
MEKAAGEMISPYLNRPSRSLEQYQAELIERLDRMRINDPRRTDIARQIRAIDDELAARE